MWKAQDRGPQGGKTVSAPGSKITQGKKTRAHRKRCALLRLTVPCAHMSPPRHPSGQSYFNVSDLHAAALFTGQTKQAGAKDCRRQAPSSRVWWNSGNAICPISGQRLFPDFNSSTGPQQAAEFHGPLWWCFNLSWVGFNMVSLAQKGLERVRGKVKGSEEHLFTFPIRHCWQVAGN